MLGIIPASELYKEIASFKAFETYYLEIERESSFHLALFVIPEKDVFLGIYNPDIIIFIYIKICYLEILLRASSAIVYDFDRISFHIKGHKTAGLIIKDI